MSWLNGLSAEERTEIYLDACAGFNGEFINEAGFREVLAKLGYNATDIEETVRQHAPSQGSSSEG